MFSANFAIRRGAWINGEEWRSIDIHVGPMLLHVFPWGDIEKERGTIVSTRVEFMFPVMIFRCRPRSTVASPLETLSQWVRRRTQRRRAVMQHAYLWRDKVGVLKVKNFGY